MAGPVVKIDPATLPQRANVHWLGQQPYEVLPHLVAEWDVCLLPFARNESTRFISPTKTLEYMAAEKPIVSTPIHDVVSLYGDCVSIAATAGEFIAACALSLAESAGERQLRLERMRSHVTRCTWDRTAREIHQEIEAMLQAQQVTDCGSCGRTRAASFCSTHRRNGSSASGRQVEFSSNQRGCDAFGRCSITSR